MCILLEKYHVSERGELAKVVWGEITMEINLHETDKLVKCFYIIWTSSLSTSKECLFTLG